MSCCSFKGGCFSPPLPTEIPEGPNNFGVQHFGRYQEEWIFQIYDTDELGYELKVSDWSTFIVSEIKDFPHLNDPAAQNVGRWITRKVQYDYSGTLEGDVNATAIETHDNPYFNQPNYTLNLGPVGCDPCNAPENG